MAAEEGAVEEVVAAIFRAAGEGDVDIVAGTLDKDPGLLSSVRGDDTLLTRAVMNGHVALVGLLLERGAEVNQANAYEGTALICAASRGHEEMVSMLLSSGADLRRRSHYGQTALMCASWGGHVAVVRLLLRSMKGVGLNERSEYGRTALWCACLEGHADVVRALLLAGADHTIADTDDTTPLHVAEEGEHHECVALLQVSAPLVSRRQGHFVMAPYAWSVVPVLYGVAPHNLCLCCSGGSLLSSLRLVLGRAAACLCPPQGQDST
jgi:ankyrin repeat protein